MTDKEFIKAQRRRARPYVQICLSCCVSLAAMIAACIYFSDHGWVLFMAGFTSLALACTIVLSGAEAREILNHASAMQKRLERTGTLQGPGEDEDDTDGNILAWKGRVR